MDDSSVSSGHCFQISKNLKVCDFCDASSQKIFVRIILFRLHEFLLKSATDVAAGHLAESGFPDGRQMLQNFCSCSFASGILGSAT
jgi:hypothetical protein